MPYEKAIADCPYDEPLHYHHDGCPACYDTDDLIQITTGYMKTAMGNFAITKTIELISTDDYMSMILSNRDVLTEELIKDLFFDESPNQRFRVIK